MYICTYKFILIHWQARCLSCCYVPLVGMNGHAKKLEKKADVLKMRAHVMKRIALSTFDAQSLLQSLIKDGTKWQKRTWRVWSHYLIKGAMAFKNDNLQTVQSFLTKRWRLFILPFFSPTHKATYIAGYLLIMDDEYSVHHDHILAVFQCVE